MTFMSLLTLQNIPEIIKVCEYLFVLLPHLLDNPDKAVGDSIFSPINANYIGVQVHTPFM